MPSSQEALLGRIAFWATGLGNVTNDSLYRMLSWPVSGIISSSWFQARRRVFLIPWGQIPGQMTYGPPLSCAPSAHCAENAMRTVSPGGAARAVQPDLEPCHHAVPVLPLRKWITRSTNLTTRVRTFSCSRWTSRHVSTAPTSTLCGQSPRGSCVVPESS